MKKIIPFLIVLLLGAGAVFVVQRNNKEVAAQVTQKLQERKLEAERSKFKEGKSTSLLVAQAERDLLLSRLFTIQASIATLTTRTDLYQKDGSLLARRGLTVPEE